MERGIEEKLNNELMSDNVRRQDTEDDSKPVGVGDDGRDAGEGEQDSEREGACEVEPAGDDLGAVRIVEGDVGHLE